MAEIPLLVPALLTGIPAALCLTWYYGRRRNNRPQRFDLQHLSRLRSSVLRKKAKKRQRLGFTDDEARTLTESRSLLASANNERMRRRREMDENSLDIVDDLSSSDEDNGDSDNESDDDSDDDDDDDDDDVEMTDAHTTSSHSLVDDNIVDSNSDTVEIQFDSLVKELNNELKQVSEQQQQLVQEDAAAASIKSALTMGDRQSSAASKRRNKRSHAAIETSSHSLSRSQSSSPLQPLPSPTQINTANTILPSIRNKHRSIYGILYLNVLEARLLSSSNAACFVIISHGTQVYRTQTSKKSSTPIFNQKARIVIREREVAWPVCVSLWAKRGKRRGGGVFCVGRCTMDVRNLMTGSSGVNGSSTLISIHDSQERKHFASTMNVDIQNAGEGDWIVRNWWQNLSTDSSAIIPTQPVLTASTTQRAWDSGVKSSGGGGDTDNDDSDELLPSQPLLTSASSSQSSRSPLRTPSSALLHLESLYVPLPSSTVGSRMWHDICSLYDVHDEGRVSSEQVQQLLTSIGGMNDGHRSLLAEICSNGSVSVDALAQALSRAEVETEKEIKSKKKHAKKKHSHDNASKAEISIDTNSTITSGSGSQPAMSPSSVPINILPSPVNSDSMEHTTSDLNIPTKPNETATQSRSPSPSAPFLVEVPLAPNNAVVPVISDWTPMYLKRCPVCLVELTPSSSLDPRDCLIHVRFCLETLHSLSEDPSEIEEYATGGFLSEEYAVKNWASHMMHGELYGSDKLLQYLSSRAHFILVQDRSTGQLRPEKVPFLVKLLFRFIYQSPFGRTAHNSVHFGLMARMSEMIGRKYDQTSSKAHIAAFIAYYQINMDQFQLRAEQFKTFNEFFYRRIRPEARPIAPGSDVVVSPADCRITVFQSVSEATRIWIKGSTFSLSSLLVDDSLVQQWPDCSLAIARLAPDDYHRFHLPLDCTIGHTIEYSGGYASVNPLAIRSAKNVLTQNKRVLTVLHTKSLGDVLYIAVGATMVGSVVLTTNEGETHAKGDEHGYFAFGGSTVLLLFKQGAVQFDEDLLFNTGKSMETLIRMGESVGKIVRGIKDSGVGSSETTLSTINPLSASKLAESDQLTASLDGADRQSLDADDTTGVSVNDLTRDEVAEVRDVLSMVGDF